MKNILRTFTLALICITGFSHFVEGRSPVRNIHFGSKNYIQFDTKSKQIQKTSYTTLEEVAFLLKANPQVRKVRIEGHTDSHEKRGSKALLKLSEQRAQIVKDYLVQHGIQAHRLEIKGYADERPIQSNQTEEGRAANRRVEFNVLEQ